MNQVSKKAFTVALFSIPMALLHWSCGSEEPNEGTSSDGDTDNDVDGDVDGGADSDSNPDSDGDSNDYFPMEVGDYWIYKESSPSGEIELKYSVTDKVKKNFGTAVGEREVFVVENTFDENNERRIQFIEDDGVRAVRHFHEVYDLDGNLTKTRLFVPGFLRLDRAKLSVGLEWTETVKRTTDTKDGSAPRLDVVAYEYKVLSLDQQVTIKGKTYFCYTFQRHDEVDHEDKVYWYAPDIGKVREITGGKEELLIESNYLE